MRVPLNRLGIGTSTVHADLHLGATSPHIDIGPSTGNRGKIGFDSNNVYIGSTSGTGQIHFKNNIGSTVAPHLSGDTKMVITDSGVGIGTTPNTALHVSTASTTKSVVETTGTSSDALIEFTRGQGSGNTWSVGLDQSNSSALSFAYLANGSPSLTSHNKMTIDSSGNLLVGKTALEYENTAGHIFRNDGLQSSIRSGGNVADFNRLSSDGEIIRLSKDGTTVGSIGTVGTDVYLGKPRATE